MNKVLYKTVYKKTKYNNLRYTEVYELENGQKRVDLREWGREGDTEFPTKKGISLKLDIFKSSNSVGNRSDFIQCK